MFKFWKKKLKASDVEFIHWSDDKIVKAGNGVYYKCPNCSEENIKLNFKYCPDCGKRLQWMSGTFED